MQYYIISRKKKIEAIKYTIKEVKGKRTKGRNFYNISKQPIRVNLMKILDKELLNLERGVYVVVPPEKQRLLSAKATRE